MSTPLRAFSQQHQGHENHRCNHSIAPASHQAPQSWPVRSSSPPFRTSVKNFKEDLVAYLPNFFVAVPLVFDILYSGVQRKLAQGSAAKKMIAAALISVSLKFMEYRRIQKGGDLSHTRHQQHALISLGQWLGASILALVLLPLHLLAKKAAITGGGSLSPNIDKFFELSYSFWHHKAIGITVLNGYGLTECSPVIGARLTTNNILGSVGYPLPLTKIKVVDPETDAILPPGIIGVVKCRGPQVMKEYYKVENGLLTPTLKIKREVILKQYKAQIEAIFIKD